MYARTRNISKENSSIHTEEKYEANLKEMLDSYGNGTVKVIIQNNNDINWSKTQAEKKITLHRVLQELMADMRKHSKSSFAIIGFEIKTTRLLLAILTTALDLQIN
jgi:glucose-6-phosphate-specific signal transduction histidine kinase